MSALPQEPYHHEEADPPDAGDTPRWSGKFIEYIPRTFGVVAVHVDDLRTHPFPKGWHPASDEPYYLDDVEIWPLICEQADLPEDSPFLQLDTCDLAAELEEESEEERKPSRWRPGLLASVGLALVGAGIVRPLIEGVMFGNFGIAV